MPLRLVQSVWRNGQDFDGINGVISKLVNNCGRKRIEIDPEAIKNVPLRERTTFRYLAHALGVVGIFGPITRQRKYTSDEG